MTSTDFYPRPPRGGRPTQRTTRRSAIRFLSTPSARRATLTLTWNQEYVPDFYPRPPRGGRPGGLSGTAYQSYFYPRPPRGGRRNTSYQRGMADIFLSTPSARRATLVGTDDCQTHNISIHALREEGDVENYVEKMLTMLFLSTPSARRATVVRDRLHPVFRISIHALREEGDSKNRDKISIFKQIIQHSARI